MEWTLDLKTLVAGGAVITDGAWGTEFQRRGLALGRSADAWNLTHPHLVEEVARTYVHAGSRVILTNSFRANRIAMEKDPDLDRLSEINRAAVEISRRAASGRALVFASIGPSGRSLSNGEIGEEQLTAAFREQADVLADAGADALVLETMFDLAEARLALEAALNTGLPVVVSLVFASGNIRDRSGKEATAAEAAVELTRLGAHAIGANCGTGIEEAAAICSAMASATTLPIWIKPNAGLPEVRGKEAVYATNAEDFAAWLPSLVDAGAGFVGGCCGSTPAFISALHRRL